MGANQKNTGGKGVLFAVKGTFRVYLKKNLFPGRALPSSRKRKVP